MRVSASSFVIALRTCVRTVSRLFISPETVRTHVRNAMTKLEADTRTQAVALALRYALID